MSLRFTTSIIFSLSGPASLHTSCYKLCAKFNFFLLFYENLNAL